MGIGVSYTGYDGKTRHKVVEGAAELPRFMGGEAPRVGDSLGRRRASPSALPAAPQTDPVDGPLVGIEGNDSPKPDGQFRAVGTKGGWRLPFSRTEIEVKPSVIMGCNEVTLTKLQYDVIFSESGLAKGRTEERVVWRKSFFVLAEAKGAGGSGKFGARFFFDADATDPVHPIPKAIAFGSDADLATFDEARRVFACNYGEDGRVLADPPVKVVAVSEYTGGLD